MSKSRHRPSTVRSYSITHPPGRVSVPTQPGWDYLVFATAGVFTAIAAGRAWTVPAHRALCVPDGTRISIETTRRSAIRCLYVEKNLRVVRGGLRVVTLTPLSRELLAHAVAIAPTTLDSPPERALITLLTDRLEDEPEAPLHLSLPTDPVALDVAQAVMADPSSTLEASLVAANASRRTVERRFKSETLMSLGQWRRRARVLAAVALIAEGQNVTSAAIAVGYSSPSSLVFAFRSELGSPPRSFMQG